MPAFSSRLPRCYASRLYSHRRGGRKCAQRSPHVLIDQVRIKISVFDPERTVDFAISLLV